MLAGILQYQHFRELPTVNITSGTTCELYIKNIWYLPIILRSNGRKTEYLVYSLHFSIPYNLRKVI
jgi:hypothetical protein